MSTCSVSDIGAKNYEFLTTSFLERKNVIFFIGDISLIG